MKQLLLITAIMFLPALSHATADGPDYYSIKNLKKWDVLNIRTNPHYKAVKIGSIPFTGTCIKNLGCEGGLTMEEFNTLSEQEKKAILKKRPRWCKIKYQETTGWVNAKYLQEGSCP